MLPSIRALRRFELPRPFDAAGLFDWHRVRALPGVEAVTESTYSRTLRLPRGPATVEVSARHDALEVVTRVSDEADAAVAFDLVARMFDVHRDATEADAALARHPELAPQVTRIPGIRVPGAADPGEMLVRAMVGQQVTVASARTALSALAAELGEPLPGNSGRLTTLFPTMRAIAEHGAEILRGPAARIRAITTCARLIADGELHMGHDDDPDDLRARLRLLPGVGPWTADYVTMRVTGAPDLLLDGDVAVLGGAALLGIPSQVRPLIEWAERVAPWRTYLTAHLWRAKALAPPQPR